MELLRRHLQSQPSGYAAYLALERALMARWVARGGELDDFCWRLAPVFRRRFGPLLLGDAPQLLRGAPLPGTSARLRQESGR